MTDTHQETPPTRFRASRGRAARFRPQKIRRSDGRFAPDYQAVLLGAAIAPHAAPSPDHAHPPQTPPSPSPASFGRGGPRPLSAKRRRARRPSRSPITQPPQRGGALRAPRAAPRSLCSTEHFYTRFTYSSLLST